MTQIVCHRGASLNAPENTVSAAELALQQGGSVIELDIHQSLDGVLYVMHDAEVDRTTDGTGKIADMTSAEVDELDAGSWFDPRFQGERVPKLRDYLSRFADRAGFYLEVKEADCKAVGNIVRDLDIEDRCFTFSFDADIRAGMLRDAPHVKRMILWRYAESIRAVVEDHHAQIVEFHEDTFDLTSIKACQNAGLQVMFYTDKPDKARFGQALDLGMDYVNIDHIELFNQLRNKPSITSLKRV